jgi:DNA-binding NarL/FixJ family response regulator
MVRPKVLLADDHELLVSAIEKVLAGACDIIGQVSDGRALVAAADVLKPDVIVLDIGLPELSGLEAARQIKRSQPDVRLVFLTMIEEVDIAADAFRAGASAYLLKRSPPAELLAAIREVMVGRSYLTPRMTKGLVESLLYSDDRQPADAITPPQRQILQLVAEGRSMKQIAASLNITVRTVAFHKYRLMASLNVKTTAELVQYAVRHHIV